MHLQSRDTVRLTRREKARFWMGLLSEASEVSFMTECIRELLEEPLGPGTPLGLLLHTELHAGNRKYMYSNDAFKNKMDTAIIDRKICKITQHRI